MLLCLTLELTNFSNFLELNLLEASVRRGKDSSSTPVSWPGEFHGQRSLVGCSPWGCKESDKVTLGCELQQQPRLILTCLSVTQGGLASCQGAPRAWQPPPTWSSKDSWPPPSSGPHPAHPLGSGGRQEGWMICVHSQRAFLGGFWVSQESLFFAHNPEINAESLAP